MVAVLNNLDHTSTNPTHSLRPRRIRNAICSNCLSCNYGCCGAMTVAKESAGMLYPHSDCHRDPSPMPRSSLWVCDISAQSACRGQEKIYVTSHHHVHRHICSHIAAALLQQGRLPRDGPLTHAASTVNHILSQSIENGSGSCLNFKIWASLFRRPA
ncbi:hypothetical protein GY45DRAFT_1321492 [Cubamyces sp. BRFM 1775]|nr:hypothetical protein GY45DRAFT_1321492 [Cubamyces sp. BRFM 1775]